MGWGKSTAHAQVPSGGPALYCPDFYLEESTPWVTFSDFVSIRKRDLLHQLGQKLSNAPEAPVSWRWKNPGYDEFAGQVQRIKSEIQKGELEKAVPVVYETAEGHVEENQRLRLLKSVLERCEKRIPYGYWTNVSGIIGASPEILFTYNQYDQTLETMALAGTRLMEIEKNSSLLQDPKEMYEHELVVRALRQKLKPLGDLSISPTYVWELNPICHLRTDIRVELKNNSVGPDFFTKTIQLLHPTPALGIYSERLAFKWLKNIDKPARRRRFGAPFGVVNLAGRSRVLVAIRNIQWDDDDIRLGSGCGVVKQSDLQREWQELEIKRKTVKDLLEI